MDFLTAPDRVKLAYLDEGPKDALPILCLSGLTRNTRDFDYVVAHFPQHRWIRMDYRGRGQSDWLGKPDSYTVPQEAQDALALMDHLGLDRVALFGTSRGGLIGMALAATAKERLLGLCLNDVGPELDMKGLDVIAKYIGKPIAFETVEDYGAFKSNTMPDFQNVPMERWVEEADHQTLTKDGKLTLAYDPALADAFAAAASGGPIDLWPLYDATAGLPTLIIRAANSNLLKAETVAQMLARNPTATAIEVADRGHVPFLDEPEVLAALPDWIARCQ